MNNTTLQRIGPYRLQGEEKHEKTERGLVVTYPAEDRAGRPVAVRVLPNDNRLTPEEQETYSRHLEAVARAVAALTHPPRTHAHLQRIYDVSVAGQTPQGTRNYLVTEHLTSASLRDRLDESGPLSLKTAAEFITHIASAVDSLHGADVVHGAVHTGNIHFDNRDRQIVKLVGIENAAPAGVERGGRTISAQDDRNAFPGLLYEMLTARPAPAVEVPLLPGNSETVTELNALLRQPVTSVLDFAMAVRAALPAEPDEKAATDSASATAPAATASATNILSRWLMGIGGIFS